MKIAFFLSLLILVGGNSYSQTTSSGGCPNCKYLDSEYAGENRPFTTEEIIQLGILKGKETELASAVEKQWRVVTGDTKAKITNISEVFTKLIILDSVTTADADCHLKKDQLQKILTRDIRAKIKVYVDLPMVEYYLRIKHDMKTVPETLSYMKKMVSK